MPGILKPAARPQTPTAKGQEQSDVTDEYHATVHGADEHDAHAQVLKHLAGVLSVRHGLLVLKAVCVRAPTPHSCTRIAAIFREKSLGREQQRERPEFARAQRI